MTEWTVLYTDDALHDLAKLDHTTEIQVLKGIKKVSTNPLSQSEGGYGKPLGNKGGNNLTGFLKIKFLKLGIRVVYKLERKENEMIVIIVSVRDDDAVYREAAKRIQK